MKNLLLLPILFFLLISCDEGEIDQAIPEEKIVKLSIIEDEDIGTNLSWEKFPKQIDPESNRAAVVPQK